ncbi:hypothetical protein M2281_004809 [Mesorhizobium soli]|jgi:hypothetical protein|uniref:hypothetical protein n=1 Tax=Pseudaminobacter soli (ex Li et al. 2025) TaxID=1295366 RepID=UPI00247497AE|nr:hypothetical protein [Mesorhizobium soli]MDH6234195.1 hypothetical protein [Mesorhizobium soli]
MRQKRHEMREALRHAHGTLRTLRRSIAAVDADHALYDLGALLAVAEQEALCRLREAGG